MYGFDLAWYNFKFSKKLKIDQDPLTGDLVWKSPNTGEAEYEDSKLTVAFLNVPIMYYFQPRNGLRLGFGGYAGYKLDEYNKVYQSGKTIRAGEGDFNLNNVQYGLRAQAGWRGVDLFCNYSISTLFKDGKGPTLTPIAFGVTF
jgi:hypothetical protein